MGMAREGIAMDYPLKSAVIQIGDVALLEVRDPFSPNPDKPGSASIHIFCNSLLC